MTNDFKLLNFWMKADYGFVMVMLPQYNVQLIHTSCTYMYIPVNFFSLSGTVQGEPF